MSSLREMLEKQKQLKKEEKSNGQSISKAVAEAPVKAIEKSSNISEEKQQQAQGTVPTGIGSGNGTAETGVVGGKLTPPAGLSVLQRAKWIKDHAKKDNEVGRIITNGSGLAAAKQANSGNVTKAPEQKSTSQIAAETSTQETTPQIGHREAEKTNDGNIELDQLRQNLVYLANNIDQKEIVGQVVRTIAVQLKNNPSLTPYMKNADVDLVVRGMRAAYQIAARKKAEKSETKAKNSKNNDELLAAFKDAGLDGLNLGLRK